MAASVASTSLKPRGLLAGCWRAVPWAHVPRGCCTGRSSSWICTRGGPGRSRPSKPGGQRGPPEAAGRDPCLQHPSPPPARAAPPPCIWALGGQATAPILSTAPPAGQPQPWERTAPSQLSAATRTRGPPCPPPGLADRLQTRSLRGLLPQPHAPSDFLPGAERSSSCHSPALGPASLPRAQWPDREACLAHLLLAALGALGHRLIRSAAILDNSPASA